MNYVKKAILTIHHFILLFCCYLCSRSYLYVLYLYGKNTLQSCASTHFFLTLHSVMWCWQLETGFPFTTSMALTPTHMYNSSSVVILKVSQEPLKRHSVLNADWRPIATHYTLFAGISLFISSPLVCLLVPSFLGWFINNSCSSSRLPPKPKGLRAPPLVRCAERGREREHE